MKAMNTKSMIWGLILTTGILYSCQDEESSTITNEEAADLVASSLSVQSSGFTLSASQTAELMEESNSSNGRIDGSCGFSNDTTLFLSSNATDSFSYDYELNYGYAFTCIPPTLTVDFTCEGNFDGTRVSSTNTGSGEWVFTIEDDNAYAINGLYEREGTFQSKVRNKVSTNSTISITFTDIIINSNTGEITGGEAVATISGSVDGNGDFNFTASIEFKGSRSATVTIQGEVYNINLTTGSVSVA